MNMTSSALLTIICRYFALISPLIMLVIGIIIVAGKQKSVRILGIGYILSSLSGVISALKLFPTSIISRLPSPPLTILAELLGYGTLVCICIFLHKNYGKKFIYIPVFVILIAGRLFASLSSSLLSRLVQDKPEKSYWVVAYGIVVPVVIDVVNDVLITVIMYKNQKSEKVIPKAWYLRIINVVVTVASAFIYALFFVSINRATTHIGLLECVVTISEISSYLCALIVPLYIMIRSVKKNTEAKA